MGGGAETTGQRISAADSAPHFRWGVAPWQLAYVHRGMSLQNHDAWDVRFRGWFVRTSSAEADRKQTAPSVRCRPLEHRPDFGLRHSKKSTHDVVSSCPIRVKNDAAPAPARRSLGTFGGASERPWEPSHPSGTRRTPMSTKSERDRSLSSVLRCARHRDRQHPVRRTKAAARQALLMSKRNRRPAAWTSSLNIFGSRQNP